MRSFLFIPRLLFALSGVAAAGAAGLPVLPVGLDAYRQWDRWPLQRIGVRAYLRSTYDRAGGNERADAAHFLYQLAPDRNVTLDVAGRGILYFARFNHWHGSPWHFAIDGVDHVVTESSTATPHRPVANSTFVPADALPEPLAWTWSRTHGADLLWVPLGFEHSCRLAYGRTFYGTGYYIYHLFDPDAQLSQPIRAWDDHRAPDRDVLDLLNHAGRDLLPADGSAEAQTLRLTTRAGTLALAPRASAVVAQLAGGPTMLRALQFSVSKKSAPAFGRARLRIRWDDAAEPSIDAPVALFFGAGTLHRPDDREFLVKALPVHVRFEAERAHLACFFPMPFARAATIELINSEDIALDDIRWIVRTAPLAGPMTDYGYLHATYRDHPEPAPGEDLVLLDTRVTEGGGDWSGSFIGTSFIFTHRGALETLEGDPRFFFDDSLTPQAQGTGTEEWAGGGDYWGGRNMTLPLAGHPCGVARAADAKTPEDLIHSAYRFLLADLMPFGKNAVIRLEHGGRNESTEHYETLAYWYGLPQPTLVRTDQLQIGDAASEAAHDYASPDASPVYELASRYEWGVDHVGERELQPLTRDRGRTTTGTSEFTLALDPDNLGVLLRRKLDYRFPNQCAELWVAPVRAGRIGEFVRAGTWFLAGSDTCLFSNVAHELDPAAPVVQVSGRRFRDDEFLIPRHCTAGASRIRVRVRFTPTNLPLLPGAPLPPQAWSELRYDAYCYRRAR